MINSMIIIFTGKEKKCKPKLLYSIQCTPCLPEAGPCFGNTLGQVIEVPTIGNLLKRKCCKPLTFPLGDFAQDLVK